MFYNSRDDNLNHRIKMLNLISKIKQEFDNYSDDFIIEALMRLSNNTDELKIYLTDPLKYNRKKM